MKIHTTHRHFVAVPVVLLAFLSLVGGERYLFADAIGFEANPVGSGGYFSTASGVSGMVDAGGALTVGDDAGITLHRGGAIFKATRYASVSADDVSIELLAGAASLLIDEHALTVVALTAPVLAKTQDDYRVIPQGYQARIARDNKRISALAEIPPVWLQNETARLIAIPDADVDPSLALAAKLLADAEPLDPERKRDIAINLLGNPFANEAVISLLGALPINDLTEADAAIYLRAARMIGSENLQALFALRLGMNRHIGGVAKQLSVPFHHVRDASGWSFALLATAASLLHPLPDPFVTAWQELAKRSAAGDMHIAIEQSAVPAHHLFASLNDSRYPRYAALWRTNMQEFLTFTEPLLGTQNEEGIHDAFTEMQKLVLQIETVETPTQSYVAAQGTHYDGAWSVAKTHADLLSNNALFTVTTVLEALSPDNRYVQVRGILFATGSETDAFDFTYDVETGVIGNIVRNGKRLPNTLSLGKFLASDSQ